MKAPKPPKIPKAPPVPMIDEARKLADQQMLRNRRRGRAASILTGPRGDMNAAPTATKTLLGG